MDGYDPPMVPKKLGFYSRLAKIGKGISHHRIFSIKQRR
jgi:hypothetical protein